MENKKYTFDEIKTPVYFFIEDNKVHIDVEGMENEFDRQVQELKEKFK